MTNRFEVAAGVAIDISRELDDDYVEIWAIPWEIRHASMALPDEEVQTIGEGVLRALFARGACLGQLDGSTGSFIESSISDPVDSIMASWRRLGRDPNMGEIGWLNLTDPEDD